MHEYVFIDPNKALQPQMKSKLLLKAPRAVKGHVPKLKNGCWQFPKLCIPLHRRATNQPLQKYIFSLLASTIQCLALIILFGS